MTALEDAARKVEEAAAGIGEAVDQGRGLTQAIARFEQAVRRHDAETVRDLSRQGYSAQEAAKKLTSDETTEVEVRFAAGPTVRIARHSVTTDAGPGSILVEGFIASSNGQPRSGDTVRLAHLGIPGRGALADITASVELFSRLYVPHIRIRTTIRPEVTP